MKPINAQWKAITLLVMLLLTAGQSMAQVVVSFTLRPPYSGNLYDYSHLENKAIITLTNTSNTTRDVRLIGSITNETQGLYIQTGKDYRPSMPITIGPNATVILTANPNAMNFLDQGNVTTNASEDLKATIVRTGLLPEGIYKICVDVYDYNTESILSTPGTGCFTFNISQLDPPIITNPVINQKLPFSKTPQTQTVVLNWTPPIGNLAGGLIRYDLVVVKVLEGQDPNDAINGARDFRANNPVLYKQNIGAPVYVRQAADLPFEQDQLYAVQVIAKDENGKLVIRNGGKSEVITFHTGDETVVVAGGGPGNTDLPGSNLPNYYTNTHLTGNLKYYWPLKNNIGGAQSQYSGLINKSLAGTVVKLVIAYQLQNPEGDLDRLLPGNIVPPCYGVKPLGSSQITTLATATTSADGSFSFNVPGLENINFNGSGTYENFILDPIRLMGAYGSEVGAVSGASVSGIARPVLMVTVENHYYCQPIQFKSGVPQDKNLGTFYARVKDIKGEVLVKEHNSGFAKTGVDVLLLRKINNRPLTVAKDELSPGDFSTNEQLTVGGKTYEILAKKTTGNDGKVQFDNMVFFNYYSQYDGGSNPNDRYYILARVNEANSNYSFQPTLPQPFLFQFGPNYNPNNPEANYFGYLKSNSNYSIVEATGNYMHRYKVEQILRNVFEVQNAGPRIYTTVRNTAAGVANSTLLRTEPGVKCSVYRLKKSGMQKAKDGFGISWSANIIAAGEDGWAFFAVALDEKLILERTGVTDDAGKLNFTNLASEFNGNNDQVGCYRFFVLEKEGFHKKYVRIKPLSPANNTQGDLDMVKEGEAFKVPDINMTPDGGVRIKLVGENNLQVLAQSVYYIDPDNGQAGTSKPTNSFGEVVLKLPTGNSKIVVNPTNTDLYQRDTFSVIIPENSTPANPVTIELKVKYRLHRIHFIVKDAFTGARIKNAKVKLMNANVVFYNDVYSPYAAIENPGNPSANASGYTRLTNDKGGVDFAFKNSATSFTFRITKPGTADEYVAVEQQLSSVRGKKWKLLTIDLDKGRVVKGKVKLGQVAIAGATVRTSYGVVNEVLTNDTGYYEMHNVPREDLIFSARKSGYVGMVYREGEENGANASGMVFVSGNSTVKVINFKFSTYGGLDLTRLLGFPLEVTELKEQAGIASRNGDKEVEISGFVSVSDSLNEVFKITEESVDEQALRSIEFSRRIVVADNLKNDSNIAYARPKTLPMLTGVNNLDIKVHNYIGIMKNTSGIVLDHISNLEGSAAKAKVEIQLTSFTDNNLGSQNSGNFYLTEKINNQPNLNISVFPASGFSLYDATQGIGIGNSTGQNWAYTLHGFNADALAVKSMLFRDSILLNTLLHTNLSNVSIPDLALNIGDVKIRAGELKATVRAQSFQIPLDSFNLNSTKVYIDDMGIHFDGFVNALGMQIPFNAAGLFPTRFEIADNSLAVNDIKLLGVVPLKVNSNASFGYDAGQAAWCLSLFGGNVNNPAAELKTEKLNGLSGNQTIPLASVYLYSNGYKEVNLFNDFAYSYKFYNIADYSIHSVMLYNNSFKLPGSLDIQLPDFAAYTTAMNYEKLDANNLKPVVMEQFAMNPISTKGIKMAFNGNNNNAMTITPGKIVINGSVSDENPEVFQNIKYTLTKTANTAALVIDEPAKRQSMPLGGVNANSRLVLTNLSGDMHATDTGWSYLRILGDMPESMGLKPEDKRLTFDVRGALEVNDQGMSIKNLDQSFEGMTMRYDMQNHRLIGQLHYEGKVPSGPSLNADATICFDKTGYYFLMGGSMEMKNPKVVGQAFILIGDYAEKTAEMGNMLASYSYYYDHFHKLPTGYTNTKSIKGFFFEAGAEIPVPLIPNADIDLGIASIRIYLNVGGDARFGMNFDKVNMYNIGMGVFADATVGAGVTVVLLCFNTNLHALVGLDFDGTYWSDNNWKIKAEGLIRLEGYLEAGGGICDATCDGACGAARIDGTVEFILVGEIDNSGPDYELQFSANGMH